MAKLLFNRRVNILRETESVDAYGGAVVTGTIIYRDQPCRIDMYMPNQRITVPGLEAGKTFSIVLHYHRQNNLDLRENDIIQVVFPLHDPYYNNRYRVRGVTYEASHPSDPNGIIEATIIRIERSRSADSI